MKEIDCRNMACPVPVVTVKRALESAPGKGLRVLLDDGAPRENVSRFAANRGYSILEEAVEGGFALVITGSGMEAAVAADRGEFVYLVSSDKLGDGPEELGRLLMKNFIITLLDAQRLPDRLLFVNTGVLLAIEGSEVIEALESLANRGVEVFSCGICLDYFGVKEKLKAGGVTNMFSIVEAMSKAASAIKL